jgi:hypothetical protein
MDLLPGVFVRIDMHPLLRGPAERCLEDDRTRRSWGRDTAMIPPSGHHGHKLQV